MGAETIVIIIIIAALVMTAVGRQDQRRANWEARENRPAILRSSRVVMSETAISGQHPPLRGRVDQVYQTPDGALIPVDTKSRGRVYTSDVVQLSTYAAILKDNGHPVASYGYIRCAPPGKRVIYRRMQLMNTSHIEQLYARRQALYQGAIPRLAVHRGICRSCTNRVRCGGLSVNYSGSP